MGLGRGRGVKYYCRENSKAHLKMSKDALFFTQKCVTKHWDYSSEQNRHVYCSYRDYNLVEKAEKSFKNSI